MQDFLNKELYSVLNINTGHYGTGACMHVPGIGPSARITYRFETVLNRAKYCPNNQQSDRKIQGGPKKPNLLELLRADSRRATSN